VGSLLQICYHQAICCSNEPDIAHQIGNRLNIE
jgi:hypothetical protein